jgi:hypothetical protein
MSLAVAKKRRQLVGSLTRKTENLKSALRERESATSTPVVRVLLPNSTAGAHQEKDEKRIAIGEGERPPPYFLGSYIASRS